MSAEFLKGYRALDLTGLSGQLAGRMLADLGMEVIKIEPPGGDPVRRLAPFITSANGSAFRKLVESADVVLESFLPGELNGRGLGYKDLSAVNPGIVMASITG